MLASEVGSWLDSKSARFGFIVCYFGWLCKFESKFEKS